MKKQLIVLFLIIVGALLAFVYFQSFDEKENNQPDQISEIIKAMTLEEKIGQMFIIGFWGNDSSYVAEMIQQYNVSGVILLKYNMSNRQQLITLINDLQNLSKYPLFISADQEGGAVTKVRVHGVNEFTAQSQIKSAEQAYNVAKKRGEELKSLGFNVNYAPVLEIVTDKNSFLYNRVFHENIENITKFGSEMARAYQDAGVSAVPKHFPGHFDSLTDSHTGLPSVQMSKEELSKNLIPYKKIESDFVMMAHVLYPNIDSYSPASISKIFVHNILREQLNYQGIIITDDMEMGALLNNYSVEGAAVKAVQAGCDMLLYVSKKENQIKAYNAILHAVENEEIKEKRIDESVYRIMKLKIKFE